jgi:uncharacterized protein (TIGR02246 family)
MKLTFEQASTGLLALSMMLTSCGRVSDQTPKPNVDADSAAIAKTFAEYVSAWKASDAGRIANLYGDDAVILPGDHPAENGRAAITEFNKSFFDQFAPGSFEISAEDTKIIGDWAFEDGAYSFTAMPKAGGKQISDRGKYLVVLQRQNDGSWRWFRDIDNSDSPPEPSAPNK